MQCSLLSFFAFALLLASTDAFAPGIAHNFHSSMLRRQISAVRGPVFSTRVPSLSLRMATCGSESETGEIGNVDTSKAKVKEDELKTDGIINLTDAAKAQVNAIKASKNKDHIVLRVGVTKGGCSGMSYVMDFEDASNVADKDSEIKFDGFTVVVDPASLLFVYGMSLDYDDALIGGGFKFNNPNADKTCGCGLSFG